MTWSLCLTHVSFQWLSLVSSTSAQFGNEQSSNPWVIGTLTLAGQVKLMPKGWEPNNGFVFST
jgi:hypothetical protein